MKNIYRLKNNNLALIIAFSFFFSLSLSLSLSCALTFSSVANSATPTAVEGQIVANGQPLMWYDVVHFRKLAGGASHFQYLVQIDRDLLPRVKPSRQDP